MPDLPAVVAGGGRWRWCRRESASAGAPRSLPDVHGPQRRVRGHGTWYLGATYPDKWAAIAPCAGYPTLTGYGSADGKIPDSARSESERILLRASNASNVIDLAHNYKSLGVYVFHGDADRVVPVRYARQMREVLGKFHPDFSYNEYPGGSHWFGNESVDWAPIFDFFKWHTLKRDSAVDVVDFTTANPGISSTFRWASIIQQEEPLVPVRLLLHAGNVMTRAGRSAASSRRKICACWAASRSGVRPNSASSIASVRSSDIQFENDVYRSRHSAQSWRCG